jgi:hypothetical protein
MMLAQRKSYLFTYLLTYLFMTVSCYVVQAGLKLALLLSSWNCRYAPPHSVKVYFKSPKELNVVARPVILSLGRIMSLRTACTT